MREKTDIEEKIVRFAWWGLAIIVLSVTVAIRIRLLGIPLERDEGEYAYAGQLMLQGIPPYKLAYNMKFPGTYAAYALIMSIFGQTTAGIHLGLLVVNVATIALIFFLGRLLVNYTAGIAAAASYAVLSVSPSILGFAGHATHFVMLPVLGGALLLLHESSRQRLGRLFASGLIFGLSLLMKQPAVFFVVFAAIYLVCNDVQRRFTLKRILLRSLIFSAGVILPFGIALLLLWRAGVFDKFWFWAIEYARQGALPGGLNNNKDFASCVVQSARQIPEEIENLLYDPQTSGGLLIALPEADAASLIERLEGAYRVGRVLPRGAKPIQLI